MVIFDEKCLHRTVTREPFKPGLYLGRGIIFFFAEMLKISLVTYLFQRYLVINQLQANQPKHAMQFKFQLIGFLYRVSERRLVCLELLRKYRQKEIGGKSVHLRK